MFLRGVGLGNGTAGNEAAVAYYLDDVYVYSVSGNMSNLNSIDRIEVLKGPQGTLYGRNALAGVVHVVTRNPDVESAVDATLSYGNYDTTEGKFYASGQIAENLYADIALFYRNQGEGWGENLALGREVFVGGGRSARTKWVWEPGADTLVSFSALYDYMESQTGLSVRLLPGSVGLDGSTAPDDYYDVNLDLTSEYENTANIYSLNIEHDFEWVEFKNILAYQENRNVASQDADTTPSAIQQIDPIRVFSRTWTEEIQLLSPESSSFDWIFGAYFLNNSSGYDPARILFVPPAPPFGGYFDIDSKMETKSYSLFGQTTFDLSSRARLTLGARYTYDSREVKGANTAGVGFMFGAGEQEKSWSKPTYRVAIDYKFTESLLGYASYSRGFKSGILNAAAPTDPGADPEILDALEVGLKSDLLDNRLRLNVAAFHYDYQDMQVRTVTPDSLVLFLNAAESRIYGLDLSFEAYVTDRFSVQGGIEWLDTEFTEFDEAPATQRNPAGGNITVPTDLSGEPLFAAAEISAAIAAQYSMPLPNGELLWTANYEYNDGFNWTAEVDNRTHQESYGLLNLSVQYLPPSGNWNVRLWGKNMTDEEYNAFVNTTEAGGDYGSPAAPRTYGLTLNMHL